MIRAEQNSTSSMQMTAALSHGPHSPFTLDTVEIDEPRADEILVRIVATGLCHTDLFTKSVLPERLGPCVFGHEGAGVVEAVGSSIDKVVPGDHVLLSYRSCGACRQCLSGHRTYCESSHALNSSGARTDGSTPIRRDGTPLRSAFFGQSSFAEYVITSADNTVVVDPAVDPVAQRRSLAEEFGAVTVDPTTEDAVEAVRAATDGGSTHSLDTTGIGAVINQGIASLRARGTLAVVGLGASALEVNMADIMLNGKTIRGCIEGESEITTFIPELAELFTEGRFPIDRLVTRYAFSDINKAVEDQASGRVIKPVLVW